MGFFGYKRPGWFAKVVWGVFATSIVLALLAGAAILALGVYFAWEQKLSDRDRAPRHYWVVPDRHIYGDLWFRHASSEANGYLYDNVTGKKVLEGIDWCAEVEEGEPLVRYSDGTAYGYFNKEDGQVVIEPRYSRGSAFAEGLAGVELEGRLRFIDAAGQVVIDTELPYATDGSVYTFCNGYCMVWTEDGEHCGLIDRKGAVVLPLEYDFITHWKGSELWAVHKGDVCSLLDKELKTTVTMEDTDYVYMADGDEMVVAVAKDHSMRMYDLQGRLLHGFVVSAVLLLEYETDEILLREVRSARSNDEETEDAGEATWEPYHPMATARLRSYETAIGHIGLMAPDGHAVTKPIYRDIRAIGADLYLCQIGDTEYVVVNGKGEEVR